MMALDLPVIAAFLVFCRVGSCLMIVPGLSSARVPLRVRLFLALVISLAIAPSVEIGHMRGRDAGVELAPLVLGECLAGASIGLLSRLLIEAIELAGAVISSSIGLSAMSASADSSEPEASVATLLSVLAVTLLMLMDFPAHLIAALAQSYARAPLPAALDAGAMLSHVADTLAATSRTGLEISAPFLAYGLILNIAFAVLGRLVPQLPSYFMSLPLIVLGGLAVMWATCDQLVRTLADAIFRIVLGP
jgi:flagellar biosynthetic protein FliR